MADEPDSASLVRDWLAGFVESVSGPEEIRRVTGEWDAAILEQVPQVRDDPALAAELHASTSAHFRTFVGLLQRDEMQLLLPPQAVDLALSIARRQLDLGVLLKVYRVAYRAVWAYFRDLTADLADPTRTAVLVFLWERAVFWIDSSIEQLIQVYLDEREATMHGMLARRAATIHALLRGEPVASEVATRDLGYRVRAVHVALVLWLDADTPGTDPVTELGGGAAAIAEHVGGGKPLVLSAGQREVWAWLAVPASTDPAAIGAAVESLTNPGVRVAAGIPAADLAGFRSSHREARDTQRVVIDSGSTRRCTSYADVELIGLMSADHDAARSLVRRELKGLGGDSPALSRIRETVAAYLAHGGNVDAAAAALIVHKNTVRYRLSQAEELLGHTLNERRTHIDLALRYLSWFGAASD